MGYISGLSSMRLAMLVPSLCFAVILAFALVNRERKPANCFPEPQP
jgi:fucose permease